MYFTRERSTHLAKLRRTGGDLAADGYIRNFFIGVG